MWMSYSIVLPMWMSQPTVDKNYPDVNELWPSGDEMYPNVDELHPSVDEKYPSKDQLQFSEDEMYPNVNELYSLPLMKCILMQASYRMLWMICN